MNMKVALVHDWLTGMRGGEKVLEVFCELFPHAHLYTLLHNKGSVSKTIESMDIRTSFVQNLPLKKNNYRYYLPVFPSAIEKFDLRGYDVVLSSSHCVAKGVITDSKTLHVCYCFTPMRYIWDMYDQYFTRERSNIFTKWSISLVLSYLRKWDVASSQRVNKFVAISDYVAKRIEKYYDRESDIIYPPVDCSYFKPIPSNGDFYLMVSPLAPNKRVDIAIKAFNKLGLSLKIIGSGQEERKLRKIAEKNVKLMGWQSDEIVREHYATCKALIFPGEDDFGIVPLEAQACGRPVIAYGGGGALETIVPLDSDRLNAKSVNGKAATGIFFYEHTPESLAQAIIHFEGIKDLFNKQEIRENAESFDRAIFKDKIRNYVEQKYIEFRNASS
ncbi:MAG: glycosyltransferase [Candidatus Scalindua rubra]|uniref:Glycosyltransferase n=1 Tax=Candidatus Scalindua rubra TaxID=1872076 RepID=A0A1E3X9C9_9BACT|nr:MAG: glycosyltransferase [Candidatus Scalindua rubra]